MKSIQQEDRQQAQQLKRNIKRLIHDQLRSISPWWLISFHYRDHHSKEDGSLQDVADLKRKLHRIIYKSRDKSIKGAGDYPCPRMLFFRETSHQGTGQFQPTQQLPQALLLLKRSRYLCISASCREAIAEKLERLEAVK